MTWLWEHVMMAGWAAWLILLLTIVGWGVAVGTLIAAAVGSKAAREAGWASLVVATLCTGLGLGGMQLGRATVDEVVGSASIAPSQRARIKRQGYLETRSAVLLGLMGCAVPLVAGGVGTVVGTIRRRKAAGPPKTAADAAPPPAGAPPEAKGGSGGSGWLVSVALGVLALLCVAGSAAAMMAPLPGPDLDVHDPAWALMGAVDEIEAGQLDTGCAELERIEATRPRGSAASDRHVEGLEAAVDKCIDARIAAALGPAAPWEQRAKLTDIKDKKGLFAPNEEQTKRIDAALAKLPAATDESALGIDFGQLGTQGVAGKRPQIRIGEVAVSGRLPKEVVMRIVRRSFSRIRACYDGGLDRDPALAGAVTVRFAIGRDGSVSQAKAGGDLKDEQVKTCIASEFRAMSFPQPEGGIVTVSYPLELSPPKGKYQIKPATEP
ncbi:MAG: AgmX/PglI C-terminal domain-containing protein [Deltaproteobacteria bacterium]|jgi:hypothetical protein|nr:AgmX/PglI C-terminal domain-containing protein [Deltaproteobacteria bacterium]MBW2536380.1 AgmX/PglI C-terminal domain-containing protein [Deltaproteobacteria bacterium]